MDGDGPTQETPRRRKRRKRTTTLVDPSYTPSGQNATFHPTVRIPTAKTPRPSSQRAKFPPTIRVPPLTPPRSLSQRATFLPMTRIPTPTMSRIAAPATYRTGNPAMSSAITPMLLKEFSKLQSRFPRQLSYRAQTRFAKRQHKDTSKKRTTTHDDMAPRPTIPTKKIQNRVANIGQIRKAYSMFQDSDSYYDSGSESDSLSEETVTRIRQWLLTSTECRNDVHDPEEDPRFWSRGLRYFVDYSSDMLQEIKACLGGYCRTPGTPNSIPLRPQREQGQDDDATCYASPYARRRSMARPSKGETTLCVGGNKRNPNLNRRWRSASPRRAMNTRGVMILRPLSVRSREVVGKIQTVEEELRAFQKNLKNKLGY